MLDCPTDGSSAIMFSSTAGTAEAGTYENKGERSRRHQKRNGGVQSPARRGAGREHGFEEAHGRVEERRH